MSSTMEGMASDFSASWELSRGRFDQEVAGLSAAQLNHKLYPGSLSIGEMALHVAGVEIWFVCQASGVPVPEELQRVAACATEGVVNENPFPFSPEEITPETVGGTLAKAREMVAGVIYEPTPEFLGREMKSALGPMITGHGALARIAFHSGYHQGQAYQMKFAPGFPAA